jgi:hypothetical protein
MSTPTPVLEVGAQVLVHHAILRRRATVIRCEADVPLCLVEVLDMGRAGKEMGSEGGLAATAKAAKATEWVHADAIATPRCASSCQAVPPPGSDVMADLEDEEGLDKKAARAAAKKRRRRVRGMSDDFGKADTSEKHTRIAWGELLVREYGAPRELAFGSGGMRTVKGRGGGAGGAGHGKEKDEDHPAVDSHGTIDGFEKRKEELQRRLDM